MVGFPISIDRGGYVRRGWPAIIFQRLLYYHLWGARPIHPPSPPKKTSRHHYLGMHFFRRGNGTTAWNWWYYYYPPNTQRLKHLEKFHPRKTKKVNIIYKKKHPTLHIFLVHGWASKPRKKTCCLFKKTSQLICSKLLIFHLWAITSPCSITPRHNAAILFERWKSTTWPQVDVLLAWMSQEVSNG